MALADQVAPSSFLTTTLGGLACFIVAGCLWTGRMGFSNNAPPPRPPNGAEPSPAAPPNRGLTRPSDFYYYAESLRGTFRKRSPPKPPHDAQPVTDARGDKPVGDQEPRPPFKGIPYYYGGDYPIGGPKSPN